MVDLRVDVLGLSGFEGFVVTWLTHSHGCKDRVCVEGSGLRLHEVAGAVFVVLNG